MRIPGWLRYALIVLISLAWAASIIVSLIQKQAPDPSISSIFGAMAGALIWGAQSNDGGDHE